MPDDPAWVVAWGSAPDLAPAARVQLQRARDRHDDHFVRLWTRVLERMAALPTD